MDGDSVWIAILAIVASLLSAGGILSQVIAWWRAREERAAKAAEAKAAAAAELEKARVAATVEVAKVEVEGAKSEREHTGRFQERLIKRLERLEERDKDCGKKIDALEAANKDLGEKYAALDEAHRKLQGEHENLKQDHGALKEHVKRVQAENRGLRARLTRLDHIPTVEPESVAAGAQAARRAVSKQGE